MGDAFQCCVDICVNIKGMKFLVKGEGILRSLPKWMYDSTGFPFECKYVHNVKYLANMHKCEWNNEILYGIYISSVCR